MEGRVAHAVDDARGGRLAASGRKKRACGHCDRLFTLLDGGAHAILDPATAVRRRQEGGIGERRPHEAAESVTETAADGIPRARRRSGRRYVEPAVPRKVPQLDRARKNRRRKTLERVVADILHPLRIVRAIVLAPHRIAEHDTLAASLQELDEISLEIDAFFETSIIAAHQTPRCILDAHVSHRGREQEISVKPPLSQPRRSRPAVVMRACFGHKLARLDDLDSNFCLFFVRCSAGARGFSAIGVVQVVGMKRSDGVRMPDRARGKRRLQAACRCARVALHPGYHIAAKGSDRGGLRQIGF